MSSKKTYYARINPATGFILVGDAR